MRHFSLNVLFTAVKDGSRNWFFYQATCAKENLKAAKKKVRKRLSVNFKNIENVRISSITPSFAINKCKPGLSVFPKQDYWKRFR